MKFKLVTFNIKCAYDNFGINSYIHRHVIAVNKIKKEKPDFIGFQEMIPEIFKDLSEALQDEYQLIFNGRNSDFGGEGLAFAIRRETVELMGLDVFWLSETPYVPGSRYAIQSECPRICQQTLLRFKGTDKLCWVFNNHLDHIEDSARILGIKQIMERVSKCKRKWNVPAFIIGDFNAEPGSETVEYCNNYKNPKINDLAEESGGTWHDFGKLKRLPKIDYVYSDLLKSECKPVTECWDEEHNGVYISDHYPVCVMLEI